MPRNATARRARNQTGATQETKTTLQSLATLLKSARDIMRKDKGLSGDLDRLPLLTWIMFLKFLDDLDFQREAEARLAGKRFRPLLESPYRWRDWAARPDGITGPELLSFVNSERSVRPDGTEGPGLFAYLRAVSGENGEGRREVIATVFRGVDNRMRSGYLLRDVINKVNDIHFTSSEELHTLGSLYETMLREMRDAAGDSGEFYTPRPVVRFMVEATDPRLTETVLDPASGTGGFLVEAFAHLAQQVHTIQDRKVLQRSSLFGVEPKPLPYLLAQMNLLLHGLHSPKIDPGNALRHRLTDIGDKDRVDVILTNPPFGGEEERGIQGNFPEDRQTAETALLFLQLIMRRLRRTPTPVGRPARAAVVVPSGVLSSPGVARRIRADLLADFNLHTIVRLPHNVFAPYTDIKTNILFFDRSGPTTDILFCEPRMTNGIALSKTKPLRYEQLKELLAVVRERTTSDCSWMIGVQDLGEHLNLDVKNPRLVLQELGRDSSLQAVGNRLRHLADEADRIRAELTNIVPQLRLAPQRVIGEFTEESDERIGRAYNADSQLIGVSAEDGLSKPKTGLGKSPERYKVVRVGYLAYNPMRINIGSIGVLREGEQEGITSPDYVVFRCDESVVPEYLYHYLRSEPGRHAINQKTKGSVRFRLYYSQLATISIPCPEDIELQKRFAALCSRIEILRRSIAACEMASRSSLDRVARDAFLDVTEADASVSLE